MLDTLFKRYKSKRPHVYYYERELFKHKIYPVNLLQVGMDTPLQVWLKYLQNANIYCIDSVNNSQPANYSFLDEKRLFWSRCNPSDRKSVDKIMKEVWNKPRFDIIIDNTNNFENLKRYCIGKYYAEKKDEVICHSC